ncbi:MAG: hypothetical protein QW815_04425 [Nitrososphaerota archaeon]
MTGQGLRQLLSAILPLAVLAALLAILLAYGGLLAPATPQLPLEKIDLMKFEIREGKILLSVVNSGPQPVSIAQVLVNEAIWPFTLSPPRQLERLSSAMVSITYPWVYGEPVEVTLITSNGFTFTWGVEAAVLTPSTTFSQLVDFTLIGVYVGVIPVFLGFIWLPLLRQLSTLRLHFVLSITVGLLLLLGVDTLREALEVAAGVPTPLQGLGLIVLGFRF